MKMYRNIQEEWEGGPSVRLSQLFGVPIIESILPFLTGSLLLVSYCITLNFS